MRTFTCPYLVTDVELSSERESHIAGAHPDLLPEHLAEIGLTLTDPDEVRRSLRIGTARLFCKWFEHVRQGKYVVVVVVSEAGIAERHWVVTAYITRRLANGEVEWQRD